MGLLKISDNGRYFVKDGAPFFWLGDTIWPAPCAFSEEELEFYFSRRKAQGFTVAHIMIPWVSFDGTLFAVKEGDTMDNMPMWLNNNPATPNEEYFKLVDRVIQIAAKHDIIIVMLPCGGGGGTFVVHKKVITADNARAYARWLSNRYKDEPNIIWANGFDMPAWSFEDVAREFVAGIKEGGAKQLMSYHACGAASSSYFHDEDWLDMNFIQTWTDYEQIPKMITSDYHRKPPKPVVHVEGAYESGIEYSFTVTSRMVRWQAYVSVLAGGFHTYGHNDIWRKSPYWRECVDSKGANEMTILKNFFTSLEWWKLQPDMTLFGKQMWKGRAAAISQDNDFAVIYFTSRMDLSIGIGRIGAGGPVRAIWIDPTTGKQVSETVVNGERHSFTSPACCDDALLLITKPDAYKPPAVV